MSLYLGTSPIAVNSSSRNIGEIITSTIPLTDAGLHLLDGSLISGSGSYSAFVTYIASLVSSYPDLFETEANWQSSVTTYGVCGKFVYDSVNNTVRLPRITGFTEATINPTVLGDLTQAGLPNITGNSSASGIGNVVEPDGCFYNGSNATVLSGSTGTAARNSFDASLSNSIYGNSTTVQPQSIKVLYYIVIANSVKTNIEVDIDEVMTDLNGKADVDLTNTSPTIAFATTMNNAEIRTVVETYVNGTSGYRICSDKYCEQWGRCSAGNPVTVTFLKAFKDTNYSFLVFEYNNTVVGRDATRNSSGTLDRLTTSDIQFYVNTNQNGAFWRAYGYVS